MQNYNEDEILEGKKIIEKCNHEKMKSAEDYKNDDSNSLNYDMLKNDAQWYENIVEYYNCLIDESIKKFSSSLFIMCGPWPSRNTMLQAQ